MLTSHFFGFHVVRRRRVRRPHKVPGQLAYVALRMSLKLVRERVQLAADIARVQLPLSVPPAVDGGTVIAQVVGLCKRPVAQLAAEGLLRVDEHVFLERAHLGECAFAVSAGVGALAGVRTRVNAHPGGVAEHLATGGTLPARRSADLLREVRRQQFAAMELFSAAIAREVSCLVRPLVGLESGQRGKLSPAGRTFHLVFGGYVRGQRRLRRERLVTPVARLDLPQPHLAQRRHGVVNDVSPVRGVLGGAKNLVAYEADEPRILV